MNQFKKQEIAIYTTLGIAIMSFLCICGDAMLYLKMLGVYGAITGSVYLIYKTVYFILNKIYPTKNEK
jgi:hypothetical protein